MRTLSSRSSHIRVPAHRAGVRKGTALKLAGIAVLAALPFTAGNSQTSGNSGGDPTRDSNRFMPDSKKLFDTPKMIEARNTLRQKEMNSETQRLLALANQLKYEMDGGSSSTLSTDAIRDAEQIEKLAHSVREKMKASVSN
jgi:hypothetical protein